MVCLSWAVVNASSTQEYNMVEVDVALENAIAGSGSCNPPSGYKIKWEECPNGTLVLRCRTTGDPCCYANWQELC